MKFVTIFFFFIRVLIKIEMYINLVNLFVGKQAYVCLRLSGIIKISDVQ